MSDPKCKCPASIFSPHRVSKCLTRKAMGTDREEARQKKRHEEEAEKLRLANEESLRIKELEAQKLQTLINETAMKNIALQSSISAKEKETEEERLKRLQLEADKQSLLHTVATHEEQQEIERAKHESLLEAERLKAHADAEKLRHLVHETLHENNELQSAITAKERETDYERLKRLEAEEDRIKTERHLVDSHKQLDAVADRLRATELNNARAEQVAAEALTLAEKERLAREQAEAERQCLMGYVKIQADQNAQEVEKNKRLVEAEREKAREAEKKKAALIALIQSDLDSNV